MSHFFFVSKIFSPYEKKEIALFWDFTQRIMVVPYRRFGTTYRSYLQRSSSPGTLFETFFTTNCLNICGQE